MFCQFIRTTKPQKPYLGSVTMVTPLGNRNPLMINCQIQPRTMPPMRLGMKKIVLKALVPFSPLVNSIARAKAPMLIVTTLTRVKRTLNHSEVANSLLMKASL